MQKKETVVSEQALEIKKQQIVSKMAKKLLQRQIIQSQITSRLTPASDLKGGSFLNFTKNLGKSEKLKPIEKRPYKIIDKPTDVTCKMTDLKKTSVEKT